MSFGQVISQARKKAGLSQKQLAERMIKEDGTPISPQYLNDIEHDRRRATDFVIEALVKKLRMEEDRDYLYHLAGALPPDIREQAAERDKVVKAYQAFRRKLR